MEFVITLALMLNQAFIGLLLTILLLSKCEGKVVILTKSMFGIAELILDIVITSFTAAINIIALTLIHGVNGAIAGSIILALYMMVAFIMSR